MIDQFTPLYYLCEVGGLVMIGGGILLIYKEKIYIDRETKQVTEVEVPFFGKLKTNVPALALFALGFIPLIYPLIGIRTAYLRVRGSVSSQLRPVFVYAVVEVRALENGNGEFDLPIPVLQNPSYTPEVVYVAGTDPILVRHYSVQMDEQNKGVISLIKMELETKGNQKQQSFVPNISQPPEEFKH